MFRWFNDPPGALGAVIGLVNPLLRPVGLTLLIVAVVVVLSCPDAMCSGLWSHALLEQGSSPIWSPTP